MKGLTIVREKPKRKALSGFGSVYALTEVLTCITKVKSMQTLKTLISLRMQVSKSLV